jgi:hypothetical protein
LSTGSAPAPPGAHLTTIRGRASASSGIEAPAACVYSILADYNRHHPRVLPREYFKSLEVEEGGVGAGTRIHVTMRVLGTTIEFQHIVSEPEPGRVLVESDADGGTATSFTVDPLDSGAASMLTISTEFTTQRRGILGQIERYLTIRTLRRIYKKELSLIAKYAQDRQGLPI